MATRNRRADPAPRYPLRFGIAAFLLIAGTLVLVLFVLPQRYVLSSGFRESGMTFPAPVTPFLPVAVVPVAARPLPTPPPDIPPGPAELFWDRVTPLLESGRYAAAVPLFETYLSAYPADEDVRRELAVTLLSAGRGVEAVPVLRALLANRYDREMALLLARTLRDLGRVAEASEQYARLSAQRPDDVELTLEWARAHAWARDFEAASSILEAALAREPANVALRVELAQVYYSLGRLEDARALLEPLDDEELERAGARVLRDDVLAALYVPPPVVVPTPPPTPLEEAVAARSDGDFARSRAIFEAALEGSPDDVELWQAYADLLEYELSDFEGAHRALLEVERLSEPSAALQLRLAQLEIWTDRTRDAASRLEALLVSLDAGSTDGTGVSRADVLALLGDIRRWDGDRIQAARTYQMALAEDPENERALDGIAALEDEVRRTIEDVEAPRVAATAYSLADTDEYSRLDLGGEWVEIGGDRWAWGGVAGHRWLRGFDLDDLDASRSGIFVDLEVARWWRWGTVRTSVDFGAERVRGTWDPSFGASVAHRSTSGARSEARYEHGPAHPVASTLQSALAAVVHDRLLLTHERRLGERWSLASALDAAWLRATSEGLSGDGSTGRVLIALGAGRSVTGSLTLGLASRVLFFTDAAPLSSAGGTGTLPLFWDPRAAVSVGPYAQLNRDLSTSWKLSARVNPGLAMIDERRRTDSAWDVVPHFSAELGVRREGPHLWTSVDLFYYQGQFDGYRTYGARVTFSARDLPGLGGAR